MANEQSGRPRELYNSGRVVVKKSRKNPFWSWFLREGSRRFREVHGRDYDKNSAEDRRLITELWNSVKQSLAPRPREGSDDASYRASLEEEPVARLYEEPGIAPYRGGLEQHFAPFEQSSAARQREGPGTASQRDNSNHNFIPVKQSLAPRPREGRDGASYRASLDEELVARLYEEPGNAPYRGGLEQHFAPFEQSLAARRREGPGNASRRDNLNHKFIPFEQSLAARRREGPGDVSQRDNSNHRFVRFEQSLAARRREGPSDASRRDNSNHNFIPVKQSLAASKSEGFGYISRSGSLEQSSSMRSNTASVSRFDLPTSPHTACNSMRSNTASVTSLDLPTSSHTAYNSKRSNIEAKRFLAKRDYFDNLRYRYATEGAFPEVLMQFITVSPYIVMSSMNDEILVYPAEISITDFSLRRGIQSCWSSLVNFDPKYLGVNRHLCDYNVVEQKAAVLDIPLRTSLGINPCNVWKILTTKCHSNGVLVCDAEQAEIVERALAFLAGTVGCEELTKHAEVVERMFTAQSFMAHLARDYYRVVKAPAPIHLKRDRIDLEFSKAKERSRCFSKCCDYHESRLSDHQSRQHCPLSRAAVLIDAVCTLSFSANLDNFRDHYVPEKHLMNIVLVDSPSLQNDHDMSRRTEHAVNGKTAQADRGAAKSTNFGCYSKKSPKIRYEIVSPEENPFKRHRKVKVDLIHAISRMAKMCSMDDPIVIHP